MDKYLTRRWARAQAYTVAQVKGHVHTTQGKASIKGLWYAPSSAGGKWHTHAALSEGKVCSTACSCPDYGECTWNGLPVCKHTLALCAYLTLVVRGGNVSPTHTISQALSLRRSK